MPSIASDSACAIVVHRVDAPRVARAVVRHAPDAVERRVAQVDVGRRHVDLRPQRVGAVFELAGAHAAEHVEVLGDGPVPVRALAPGLGQRPAVLAHLVRRQVVDVGQALLNELFGPEVQLLEVVRCVELAAFPVEAEPVHVLANRIDVLDVLLRGIRVVEPEIALAAELERHAEVQADRLRVADVQVSVRLGREARVHAPAVLPGFEVLGDDGPDEIEGPGCVGRGACAGRGLGGHPVILSA